MNKLKKHAGYYISLILILSVGGYLSLFGGYDVTTRSAFIVLTTFFYVLWGVLHHVINHDASSKIVIEYVLMGALGITIVLFFLKSS